MDRRAAAAQGGQREFPPDVAVRAASEARGRRDAIDGLRGVAVLAVLLFHTGLGAPGGYVGVDVFFVLSGYLITRVAWTDLRAGRFSAGEFWERRARRILPALVVVGAVVLAIGGLVLLPDDYAALGRALAWQAVGGANVFFWSTTDYFAGAAERLAWLHTWSLAVEEQFYVVAPLLLVAVFRARAERSPVRARRRYRGTIFAPAPGVLLVVGLLLASFATSVFAVARAPWFAFYLLPARAWELLLGVLVAVVAPFAAGSDRPGRRLVGREAAALLGLVSLLVPVFAYAKTTPFPGLAALPPCLGTALILWTTADATTRVGTALSAAPLVAAGRISYSLYLWHWPLLVLARAQSFTPLTIATRSALLVVSCALAWLTWRFVETPFRERRVLATWRSFAGIAAGALVLTIAAGGVVSATGGLPQRFPPASLRALEAKSDRAFLRDVSVADVQAGNVVRIGAATSAAPPRLLVWGDSHAMAALPAFAALLAERGEAGVAVTHVSSAPVVGFVREAQPRFGLGAQAPRWAEAVLAFAHEQRIADVVLIANWNGYRGADGERAAELEAALLVTVERLVAAGSRPWVLLQIPRQSIDVPEAMARAAAHGDDPTPFLARPASPPSNGIADGDPQLAERIVAAGGRVLDPRPRFLDASGARYVVTSGDVVLYADTHHLTASGARAVLLPLLRDAFPSP
ncbi:acyltransferase [Candidatus Binatia bacterium]|nr:acyltransferase [Candidatus Binatia bacterium]